MKTALELNEMILNETHNIRENYPELLKYLNELPVTIPYEENPLINIKTLSSYYNSLTALIEGYEKNKNIQSPNNLNLSIPETIKMEGNNSLQDKLTEVNNIIISYNDVGEGSIPVIFLHGFPFDKSMWIRQLEKLKNSNRVIACDIRGFGKSSDETSHLSIDLFAEDLVAFMDKLNIDRAIICGLSMGGYIALNAISRFPERFKGLILCDTQCIADSLQVKENRIKTIEQINLNGVELFNNNFIKNVFHSDSLTHKMELVENLRSIVFTNSKVIITAGLTAMAERSETCAHLNAIIIPTLIICGREDQVTPLKQSEFIHKNIKNSVLKVIANAGHVSNLEQPEEFNKHLQNFLNILNAPIYTEIPFDVKFKEVLLTVQSLDTVDYLLYNRSQRVGIITPERNGKVLTWSSRDIDKAYAQQIGELVAAHENL